MARVRERRQADQGSDVVRVPRQRRSHGPLGPRVVGGLAGPPGKLLFLETGADELLRRGRACRFLLTADPESSAGEAGGGGYRRHPCPGQPPPRHGFCWPFALSNPLGGSFSYGNEPRLGTSFPSTPSPRRSPAGCPFSFPATARSAMSMTSSSSLRPFGKPAVSPARTPRRFGVAVGRIERFTRSMSASFGPV